MLELKHPIILASNSHARFEMLQNAGLDFIKCPADIDEDAILQSMQVNRASAKEMALELSAQKALAVSLKNPDVYIIGSDQILELDGQIFQKAKTTDEARDKLKTLRGKTHHLISSVSVVLNGQILWQNTDAASLTMHDFTDEFLEEYLTVAATDILQCVGAYAFEKHGAWLFTSIDANFFTILGMPLLALLAFFQQESKAT